MSECLGFTIFETRDCKIDGSGRWEPGAWKMEPYTQYPVTGAARVRSDPSCAGQARKTGGPNILIDVTPALAGTLYLRQEIHAIENN